MLPKTCNMYRAMYAVILDILNRTDTNVLTPNKYIRILYIQI